MKPIYEIDNKPLTFNGKPIEGEEYGEILLTVQGTSFPDRVNSMWFELSGDPGNEIYVDYKDGTGVHTYQDVLRFTWNDTARLYYYQDLADPSKIGTVDSTYPQRRTISIKVKNRSLITRFWMQSMGVYGEFPEGLAYYTFKNLFKISLGAGHGFDGFPIKFKGLRIGSLELLKISETKPDKIPEWILESKTPFLHLQSNMNLSGASSYTGTDKLWKIPGLQNLTLSGLNLTNANFPANLNLSPTLVSLRLGGNNISTIDRKISSITNLRQLSFGRADGSGYSNLKSWGVGIGSFTELHTLYVIGSLFTDDVVIPPGFNLCRKLKTFHFITGFDTDKVNKIVDGIYDIVISNQSPEGDFMEMNINIGSAANIVNSRPSGNYQSVTTPSTPMEKIYYMTKNLGHTWTVTNTTGNGTDIYNKFS